MQFQKNSGKRIQARSVNGRTVEGRLITMDTMAKKVKISIGGGEFIVEQLWQAEGQEADILLGNNFLIQQTFIHKAPENIFGFQKGEKTFWTERIKHAKSIVGPGFTDQYQKSQQNRGDYTKNYKPRFVEILQYKQQEEVLIEESSEDEEETSEEEPTEESAAEEEEAEFIHEHNLKIFQARLERQKEKQKKHTLEEIKGMLKRNIDIDPLKFWKKDPVVCELQLHDLSAICRKESNPHYNEEVKKEFLKEIGDLEKRGLIRPSISPHRAPAFFVKNHAEEVRGKARMVIDYRDLNDKTIQDGYKIADGRVLDQ